LYFASYFFIIFYKGTIFLFRKTALPPSSFPNISPLPPLNSSFHPIGHPSLGRRGPYTRPFL
ncbi:hypothetical protein, partial [Megasphaera massiliensis]|uniref:hypothetical protein n=1 Tax=Megasphaera massiliensis TaxID=1232428 RepID=UPI003AB2A38C